MEAKRSLAFGCGHQTCDNCGDKMTACPFCRQSITAKIRLFE
jgi:E3 ubiquitin-protein ligase RGLG